MPNLPSPARLAALGEAVNSVVPAAAFGFTRRMEDGRTSIFHIYPQGLGEWILADDLVPTLVLPSSDEAQQSDLAALTLDPNGAFERFLWRKPLATNAVFVDRRDRDASAVKRSERGGCAEKSPRPVGKLVLVAPAAPSQQLSNEEIYRPRPPATHGASRALSPLRQSDKGGTRQR